MKVTTGDKRGWCETTMESEVRGDATHMTMTFTPGLEFMAIVNGLRRMVEDGEIIVLKREESE